MSAVRLVIAASRPLSWVNTALPFLAAAYAVERGPSVALVLGFLYFLVPFNVLMYGVNDIFDYASDVANPRKASVEGALVPPGRRGTIWAGVLVTNVPFLLAIALVSPPAGTAAVLVAAAAAVVYSAPPLRTKERPVLDSLTSASHFVLPAIAGFLVAGASLDAIPWPLIVAFAAWAVASHATGAVQDIAYDRAVGIGSIATAFGARPTAAIALGCYAIACVVPVAYGLLGVLAGATLAAYLLLPLSILADPREVQAHRAWRSFLGMNLLAGFVLTQLLLAAWGFYPYEPAAVVAFITVVMASMPLLLLVTAEVALRTPAAPGPADPPPGRLTVVVPCRDEATRLPAMLAAIAHQDHPDIEVVVVDDASADGSAKVARELLARLRPGAGDRVVRAGALPRGWAGKSWACDRGMAAATGSHVLFLDADTILTDPRALGRLAAEQRRTGAGLVSGVTTYALGSPGEHAAVPGFPMTIFGLLPLALVRATGGRPASLAFAYGPLLFVDRAAYARVGGHAAVPGSEREDVDLARTFVRGGERVQVVHAAALGSTRHYPDARRAMAAWRRVYVAYGGGSFAVALAAVAVTVAAWLAPIVVPLVGLAVGDTTLVVGGVAALGIVAAFRLLLAIRERMPVRTVLWHPVTVSLTLAAQVASIVDAVRGRPASWRGRTMGGSDT